MTNPRTFKHFFVSSFIALLHASDPAFGQEYTITDLGTLGGDHSEALAINNLGEVVGFSDVTESDMDTALHAFLWTQNNGMLVVGTLDEDVFAMSRAAGINDFGKIVGRSHASPGTKGFLWQDDTMIQLGTLGGTRSSCNDINGSGIIAGYAYTSTNKPHAGMWIDGNITDLGTLGGPKSEARAINEAGQIVGYAELPPGEAEPAIRHAVLWENGTAVDVGTLGGRHSEAFDINDAGHIVGWSDTDDPVYQYHGFIWRDGQMTDLGAVGLYSVAKAINNYNAVVGYTGGGAFVWDRIQGIHILEDLIPPDSGWSLEHAYDINDAGQIVGIGRLNGAELHAVLLTPTASNSNLIQVPGDYTTIQAAIDAAQDGDEVVVADGVYTGTGNKNLDFGGKAITVWSENGPENCIIDSEGDGRGFYLHSGETETSIVDGFTITNGDVGAGNGGAILLDGSHPIIRSCRILKNTANSGGGIYCADGGLILSSCTIADNTATILNGGGLASQDSTITLDACMLQRNSAANHGGGASVFLGELTVTSCTLADNSASQVGGGLYASAATVTLVDCNVMQNTASSYGGGILSDLDGMLTLANCTIDGNAGRGGGGVFVGGGMPEFDNCTFSNNIAYENGGGLACVLNEPSISRCRFMGNVAQGDGGGLYAAVANNPPIRNCVFSANRAAFFGGAIRAIASPITVLNSTLVGNWANSGGGIHAQGVFVSNTILRNNMTISGSMNETAQLLGAPVELSYSNVQGLTGGLGGQGNIDADPAFVDPGYWDDNGTAGNFVDDLWIEGDYHLTLDSPCIDTGDPEYVPSANETDIEGDRRVINARIDMGADEFSDIVSVPGDYPTIQAAIDAAPDGAEIIVAPGIYVENIELIDKAITVRSSDGPSVTAIDGDQTGITFDIRLGEGWESRLEGFTITNGLQNIFCLGAGRAIIRNCVISSGAGTGIHIAAGNAAISNTLIIDNHAGLVGGGVFINSNAEVSLNSCVIVGNSAGFGGGGIGLWSHDGHVEITNCTIVDNIAEAQGGGIFVATFASTASTEIANSILWANDAPLGHEISVDFDGTTSVRYSLVQGGLDEVHVAGGASLIWGSGNIDGDPLLAPDGYHIELSSPCREAGDPTSAPASGETDIDGDDRITGKRIDIGADELAFVLFRQACKQQPDLIARPYGDVTRDGVINLDDILCVFDGFGDIDACPDGDIHPCPRGNGKIDLNDVLAGLSAFGGNPPCAGLCDQMTVREADPTGLIMITAE